MKTILLVFFVLFSLFVFSQSIELIKIKNNDKRQIPTNYALILLKDSTFLSGSLINNNDSAFTIKNSKKNESYMFMGNFKKISTVADTLINVKKDSILKIFLPHSHSLRFLNNTTNILFVSSIGLFVAGQYIVATPLAVIWFGSMVYFWSDRNSFKKINLKKYQLKLIK